MVDRKQIHVNKEIEFLARRCEGADSQPKRTGYNLTGDG